MNYMLFLLGALVFVGSSCIKPNNWREQIHSWFGAWTGIIIMFVATLWEYGK